MVSTLATSIARPKITAVAVDYALNSTPIHTIRTNVFVCEQQIPLEFEIDNLDWVSQHVLAFREGRPIGTGRLTPAGKISRVAVFRHLRRQGVGLCIMNQLLAIAKQSGHSEVFLFAQRHAIDFYRKLGFWIEGEEFVEVGIAHVMMRKRLVGS